MKPSSLNRTKKGGSFLAVSFLVVAVAAAPLRLNCSPALRGSQCCRSPAPACDVDQTTRCPGFSTCCLTCVHHTTDSTLAVLTGAQQQRTEFSLAVSLLAVLDHLARGRPGAFEAQSRVFAPSPPLNPLRQSCLLRI